MYERYEVRIAPVPHLEATRPDRSQHVVQLTIGNQTTYLTRNEAEALAGLLVDASYQRELGPVPYQKAR